MDKIVKRTKFVQDGQQYEHANQQPEIAPGTVHRFTYGAEPHVIAQVPLAGGGTVDIHGYAAHYSRDWVVVEWTDDAFNHVSCWVPAGNVRRSAEGEWRGRYLAR